jgi:hypothetical protein
VSIVLQQIASKTRRDQRHNERDDGHVILLVVQHSLDNYQAWRENFDASYPILERHGVISVRVLRGVDDPNTVLVMLRIPTAEQAYALVEDTERRSRFENGRFHAFSSVVQLYQDDE